VGRFRCDRRHDRRKIKRQARIEEVIIAALAVLAASFVTMSLSAYLLSPAATPMPLLVAIVFWGLAAWSYFPAQQARLISVAGVQLASVVVSLNASFMYSGFAGAVIGWATIAHTSPAALGFVGAGDIVGALSLASAIMRERKTTAAATLQCLSSHS
jgi:predicted MFS family arabinose efflux permease